MNNERPMASSNFKQTLMDFFAFSKLILVPKTLLVQSNQPFFIMMRIANFLFVGILLSFVTSVGAQDAPIKLNNPSFLDIAHAGGDQFNRGPRGWQDCGAPGETPPDVQPNPRVAFGEKPFFDVTLPAQDGPTYMGMVVRDNDTQESVSQRLSASIEGGKCYEMSLYLARSETYLSQARLRDGSGGTEMVDFTKAIKVRIYGGNSYCQKAELLAETPVVQNTKWKEYKLRFEPTTSHRFILIQAFYKTPTLFPYNGNVLVDNLSDIVPIPCDKPSEPLAVVEKPKPKPRKEKINRPKPKEKDPVAAVVVPPKQDQQQGGVKEPVKPIKKEKIIKELQSSGNKEGRVIKLKRLVFGMDQSEINEDAYDELDEIADYLKANPNYKVEVRGHTNDRCDTEFCNKLSKERAQSVANYLKSQDVPLDKLEVVGYGKTKPIASNRYSAGRRKNQRVEIKLKKI